MKRLRLPTPGPRRRRAGRTTATFLADDGIRRMDIREFRELGLLQEVNRRFFHPIGLALEVVVLDDGTECLGGIWDYRPDAEGIYFARPHPKVPGRMVPGLGPEDEAFAAAYDAELVKRGGERTRILGAIFQPFGDPWAAPETEAADT